MVCGTTSKAFVKEWHSVLPQLHVYFAVDIVLVFNLALRPLFYKSTVRVAQLGYKLVKSGNFSDAREEKLPGQAHPFFSMRPKRHGKR